MQAVPSLNNVNFSMFQNDQGLIKTNALISLSFMFRVQKLANLAALELTD